MRNEWMGEDSVRAEVGEGKWCHTKEKVEALSFILPSAITHLLELFALFFLPLEEA
jgi:hypothetical protein